MKKKIPKFRNEEKERQFWAYHDSDDYVDWDTAERRSFPALKPSLRTISLRLPESMLEGLKLLANKRDMPYQSFMKMIISERLQHELRAPPVPYRTTRTGSRRKKKE